MNTECNVNNVRIHHNDKRFFSKRTLACFNRKFDLVKILKDFEFIHIFTK